MPRRPMQDIVPGGRSIRDVPIPERREKPERKAAPAKVVVSKETVRVESAERNYIEEERGEALEEVRKEFELETMHHSHKRRGGFGKYLIAALIIIAVVGLALLVSSVFHAATVTLTPKTASAALSDEFTAQKSAGASGLSFETLSIDEIGSRQVRATGEKRVTTQASGTIVIYNNHSSTAQRLVKNTRFETPEGLIYRIADSVTVPGKKGTTAGSVEAVVYADEAGEKYNVGLKDFTIPGFKGDPRYETFYARSKTPLAGGFNGMVKVVPDADLAKAQADIKAEVGTSLLAQAKAGMTADQILFDGAHTLSCQPLPQENVSETQVLIKMNCSLSAAVFDREALSSHVARSNVSAYEGEPILIRNLDSIAFAPKAGFDPASQSAAFTLSGNAEFEWLYDADALKENLSGIRKDEVAKVLNNFPMIEKADVSIRPAWRRVFPTPVDDITIRKAE